MTPNAPLSPSSDDAILLRSIYDLLSRLGTQQADTSEVLVRLDERQTQVVDKVSRIDKAIFGNGTPGLAVRVADLERTVQEIKTFESSCPVNNLVLQLSEVKNRHEREDKVAEDREDDRRMSKTEYRKFRLALAASLIMFSLDLVLRLFKVI